MHRKTFTLAGLALAAALSAAACGAEAPPASTTPPEKAAAPAADAGKASTPAPDAGTPAAPAVVKEGTAPGERLPSFTAKTFQVVDGATVESDYDHAKATGVRVYVVNSTKCPYTKKYAERMAQIETEYTPKGVSFVYLYPNRPETVEEKAAWHAAKGHKAPWVVDNGGAVTQLMKGGRTPEYVVVNADGVISYRGGIDDSMGSWKDAKKQYLTDALDATLAGKAVAVPETTAAG